ncbi:2,3-diketo-L-gulonate TRAP transporter small permease protein YiaM [Pseudovibrio sp. Ad13]|uniref:TRAP transporter small permease protein n=1 Tax=Pseudovibrio brasiliensis TaxID=1898042 RepID=A0ABX8AZJ6_9HYPH|nr:MULTISPECIES: TRAP transporter small permease [Pseudovibrio]KZK79020.1 2,3-diketo-L-gulonate TRAP transporter small permease protein YiaM [Pseudovibrio sp. Ad13]QUS59004.1 TRAP transporter small permease [Pseudovibrio brasiliensis]
MGFLKQLDNTIAKVLEWILVGLFMVFFALVCILVVLRYGFNDTIYGGNEFVTIAFLFTSALGAAVGVSRREHIAITVFVDLLPEWPKRIAYCLQLALVALINSYMVYYSWNWIKLTGKTAWQPFDWPQGIVQASIPVGCGLAVLFCLIKILLTLTKRESVELLWVPED